MFKIVSFQSTRNYTKSLNADLLKILKKMPKEPKHIADAQKQRKKIKEKYSKYAPGKVTLQVLGSGANGAPSSLYLFSDQSRYLFNCGEGTQRLAHEHKMKLAKLEQVFITNSTWKNIGGLPGASLTIQDVGVPAITLHGPRGLGEIFKATRRFIVLKDLEINIADCNENTTFEDNVMRVKYVPLWGKLAPTNHPQNGDIPEDNTDYYAYEKSGRRKSPPRISPESLDMLEENKNRGLTMCYICRLQPRSGALCLQKCVQFGVPPGPLLGKLKSGQDVTLANGKIVKTADVCEPDDPGPVFIVVDCPSEDYLDSLLESPQFKEHQMTAQSDENLAYLVVHFSPKNVTENAKYKEWIERFSLSTQHLILNETNSCMGSLSVHRIQYKLNLLSSEIFPLLGDQGTTIAGDSNLPASKRIKSEDNFEKLTIRSRPTSPDDPYIYPNTFYNHHLRPKKGTDKTMELTLNPDEFIEETMQIENFPQILQQVKEQLIENRIKLNISPFPRVLFLGTGSSIPNKTRNTSGIFLELSDNNKMVMDCGEGTYGQLVRFYGQDKVDGILIKIRAIYISHLHADHHLGLIGLLQGRKKAFQKLGVEEEKVILLAPKQIEWWLNFYNRYFEDIVDQFELVANGDLILDNENPNLNKSDVLKKLQLQNINTCLVRHCPNAFGVSITDENDNKITYSGDTMPSDNLVKLGQDSNLLIHEATMEDDLAEEAVIKMHSTTSQAIEIGKSMNAKFILLTHFSQRYAKLPRFNENFGENVGIAFDNMQVKLDELPLLPILYPALKLMFVEHYEEMEQKAIKRQLKLEREKEAEKVKRKI